MKIIKDDFKDESLKFKRTYCGVLTRVLDCHIVVNKLKLKSQYYVHFQTSTLEKRYERPYPPSYELNSTTTVLLQG